MRKHVFIAILCVISATAYTKQEPSADKTAHLIEQERAYTGQTVLENRLFKQLKLNGKSSLQQVTVQNTLQSNGKFDAHGCSFGNFIAHGKVAMYDTEIKTATNISGNANA